MAAWEYCTLTRTADKGKVQYYRRVQRTSQVSTDLEAWDGQAWRDVLIEAGRQKWELVAVIRIGDEEQWHFKRPIP